MDPLGARVLAAIGPVSPPAASVVLKLLHDTEHRLDLTEALRAPQAREGTIELLRQLAEGRMLAGIDLAGFVAAYPGDGPLFEPVPADVNTDEHGRSRRRLFLRSAARTDPVRLVGSEPDETSRAVVPEYADRLAGAVLRAVRGEVDALAGEVEHRIGGPVAASARAMDAAGLLDQVARMVAGGGGQPRRPDHRIGDVVDAVAARITVDSMAGLALVLALAVRRFGVGDGGRILELENWYATPGPDAPAERMVALVVAIEVGDRWYPFELRLSTRRAAVAAELAHATIVLRYADTSPEEREVVGRMLAEAAALDQAETWPAPGA